MTLFLVFILLLGTWSRLQTYMDFGIHSFHFAHPSSKTLHWKAYHFKWWVYVIDFALYIHLSMTPINQHRSLRDLFALLAYLLPGGEDHICRYFGRTMHRHLQIHWNPTTKRFSNTHISIITFILLTSLSFNLLGCSVYSSSFLRLIPINESDALALYSKNTHMTYQPYDFIPNINLHACITWRHCCATNCLRISSCPLLASKLLLLQKTLYSFQLQLVFIRSAWMK